MLTVNAHISIFATVSIFYGCESAHADIRCISDVCNWEYLHCSLYFIAFKITPAVFCIFVCDIAYAFPSLGIYQCFDVPNLVHLVGSQSLGTLIEKKMSSSIGVSCNTYSMQGCLRDPRIIIVM